MDLHAAYTPTLLWVDLRRERSIQTIHSDLSNVCDIRPLVLDNHLGLIKNIETTYPDIICFEYDFPNIGRLQILQQAKHAFPSIPILMITEHHSEALAIWALRARVWDYLVKPITFDDLCRRITTLSSFRQRPSSAHTRNMVLPYQTASSITGIDAPLPRKQPLHRAIEYFDENYQDKVSISVLAQLCNMSPSQFTRAFKREFGATVRTYLVSYRIDRACELLSNSMLSVGDIAFTCGFHDHAYFSRMFRRHTGMSPSDYRLKESNTAR